ncbi:unnamed protein product [Linum tenue]|uniref:Uncharacterized protein n=1 Tax=Linum tenue TaxID=586396 RepID=A0AAV0LSH3_9ROSI|nr:unnamed protein product [Linum tenue]
MDPSQPHAQSPINDEDDEWDTDGFVIPSLEIDSRDQSTKNDSEAEIPEPPPPKASFKTALFVQGEREEEQIYLGPHGAPPSQAKQQQQQQQEVNSSSRKQRFKQTLKDADKRISRTGRENKLENLRELVGGGGGGKAGTKMQQQQQKSSSPKEWLDPHCHESQFEKWHPQ